MGHDDVRDRGGALETRVRHLERVGCTWVRIVLLNATFPGLTEINPTTAVQTKVAHELEVIVQVALVGTEFDVHDHAGL